MIISWLSEPMLPQIDELTFIQHAECRPLRLEVIEDCYLGLVTLFDKSTYSTAIAQQ